MSSDVYIDFSPFGSTDDNMDTHGAAVRIGHLGQMSYFAYNLVSALRVLVTASPVIEHWMPGAAYRVCAKYHEMMQEMLADGEEYARALYGYSPPSGELDVFSPTDLDGLLNEHIGERWRVRVD